MENMVKIASGIYLVRTEAGFRKALKEEFAEDYGDWKWMLKNKVYSYPESYPSVVSLTVGYDGSTYFHCNSVHVNVIKAAIADA